MDSLLNEITKKFSNISIDNVNNIIDKMENKKNDRDVDNLINSLTSLNIVPKTQKKEYVLKGMKKYRKKVFARKYKSLSGKKTELTQNQIDDIFATMNALKKK